jgi:hypothetical protein
MLWLRQRDAIGALGLAVNASRERNGHEEEAERIEELLATAQELWHDAAGTENEDDRLEQMRTAIQLITLADLATVTTRA